MTTAESGGDVERYDGWATCTCHEGPERRTQIRARLIPEGITIEQIVIELNFLGAVVTLAVDQWWGITADGVIFGNNIQHRFRTRIEADELDVGLMETYKVWANRHQEVTGEVWAPSWLTSGGVVLTKDLLDRLGEEAEAGYDVDRLKPRRLKSRPESDPNKR